MAKQRESRRSSRAIADQSTLPVELEAAERAPVEVQDDPSGGDPKGSVLSRRVRPRVHPAAASLSLDDNDDTGTALGALATAQEPTHSVDVAPGLSHVEEPTQSFGPEGVSGADALIDDWPEIMAPLIGDVIGGRYRIETQVEDSDGTRLWEGIDIDDRLVWVRTYKDPEVVRQRAAWRSLVDAFAAGAALPELLTIAGVVLLLDLVD
ncbi:MAG: hypothetical protein AAFV29_13835, partial [Myxococcota bacterium]